MTTIISQKKSLQKEKKELEESYQESKRQAEERKPKDKPNSWGIIKK